MILPYFIIISSSYFAINTVFSSSLVALPVRYHLIHFVNICKYLIFSRWFKKIVLLQKPHMHQVFVIQFITISQFQRLDLVVMILITWRFFLGAWIGDGFDHFFHCFFNTTIFVVLVLFVPWWLGFRWFRSSTWCWTWWSTLCIILTWHAYVSLPYI